MRSQKVERDLSRVVGVPALLRAQGMTSGSRIISTAIAEADEETASALELGPGAYVVDVVRIRLADGSPISLEHVRLPAERFPRLLDLPLGGSLYDLLEEHYDTVPGEAEEHIEVVAASEDEASILGTEPGAPLLSITRTTKDAGRRGVRVLPRPVPCRPHHHQRADAGRPTAARTRRGRVVALRPRVKP